MSHTELLLLGLLRGLVEVALWFLVGRGLLALLIGSHRDKNAMYKLFLIVTAPLLKAVRMISPPQIIDRHLPFIAFALLLWLWIALAYLKKLYCETHLLQCF